FLIHLIGGLQACLHDGLRERTQLRAASDQALERRRIVRVVFCHFVGIGISGRGFQDCLVVFRQTVPLGLIDDGMICGAAFPPAGIVIILGDLIEAELLIVVG